MKLNFKNVINKYKGKPCFVLAHGPSLNKVIPVLEKLKDKGFLFIGCNYWYSYYPELVPDYWVLANNEIRMDNHMEKINKYKSTVAYADSVDFTSREWVEEHIKADYLPYDQRHFNGKPCGCAACDCPNSIIKGRKTIQEELMSLTGHNESYGSGDTVALHMASLAVLLGCSKIYIAGVHLDYRQGYAKNNMDAKNNPNEFDQFQSRILAAFSTINESAKNTDSELIFMEDTLQVQGIQYKTLEEILKEHR